MKTEKQNKIIEPYAIRDINWEKQNQLCANCGYSEGFHPIHISGKKVQEKGEIFLNWLCEKFKPIQSPSGSTSLINPSGASEGVGQEPSASGEKQSVSGEATNLTETATPDPSNNIHSPMHNPKTSDDLVRVGVKAQKQEDTSNNSLRDSGDNGSTSDLQSEDSGSTPESIHNSTLEDEIKCWWDGGDGTFLFTKDVKKHLSEFLRKVNNIGALGLDKGCKNIMLDEIYKLAKEKFGGLVE